MMKWLVTMLIVMWLRCFENVGVPGVGVSEEYGVSTGLLETPEFLESSELASTETSRGQVSTKRNVVCGMLKLN